MAMIEKMIKKHKFRYQHVSNEQIINDIGSPTQLNRGGMIY